MAKASIFGSQKTVHKLATLLAIGIAIFLCFWKLGAAQVEDWDEARRGMNALGMMHFNDYLRLYYGLEPDGWAAKPPLAIWAIIGSYKLFGVGELALRFHSALSVSLFFVVFNSVLKQVLNNQFRVIALLVAASMSGFIGFHVARNGDTDGMLLFWLWLGTWALFKSFRKEKWLLLAALFYGLAFYTKGAATFLFLPGIVLTIIIIKPNWFKPKSGIFWASLVTYALIAGSWVYIQAQYGHHNLKETSISTGNSLSQMFYYDVIERFSNENFDPNGRDLLALFPALDTTMGIWNYLFFASLILATPLLFKRKVKATFQILKDNPLLLLAVVQVAIICCIYTFSASKHRWYLTPFLPFLIIIMLVVFQNQAKKLKGIIWLIGGLVVVSLSIRFNDVNKPKNLLALEFEQVFNYMQPTDTVYFADNPRQAHRLYLSWHVGVEKVKANKIKSAEQLSPNKWIYFKQNSRAVNKDHLMLFEVGEYYLGLSKK
ncbi:MAG: glycosyltransferase family 39 protein [Bacteroidetes bacterium]|nr:glycosyltransferase family 39 protein [Bacteroidota bacterium]